ncbi:hypothetical protein ACA910_014037 [Epithemia clementina (nom. ined.)]
MSNVFRRQTSSDSVTKIYYAGYLLKRSNHPVASVNSTATNFGNESPNRRLMQQRILHASATSFEYGNGHTRMSSNRNNESNYDDNDDHLHRDEHHDVFAADWEEGETDGSSLPVLPLTSYVSPPAPTLLKISTNSTDHDDDDENDVSLNDLHSSAAQKTTQSTLRPRNELLLSGGRNHDSVEAAGLSSRETVPSYERGNERHHHQRQQEVPETNRKLSATGDFLDDETDRSDRQERFWKLAADFFGVHTSCTHPSIDSAPATSDTLHIQNGTQSHSYQNGTQSHSYQNGTQSHPIQQQYQHSPIKSSYRNPFESTTNFTAARSDPIKMPTIGNTNLPGGAGNGNMDEDVQQKLDSLSGGEIGNSNNNNPYYQRAQSEVMETSVQQEQPQDFHDDKGHIWRSKYCILQDNVLYFYRNQADGECAQAKAERATDSYNADKFGHNNTSPQSTKQNKNASIIDSLARSPIPRKNMMVPSNLHDDPGHLWEKRVEVQSIGAVRSAETEYGPHCFALLSPPSYTGGDGKDLTTDEIVISIELADDKLILRARNAKEMDEWLFQFHRSIAVFVRRLISRAERPSEFPRITLLSPARCPRHITLSHGHGRALSLRRRLHGYEDDDTVDSELPIVSCLRKGSGKLSSLTPPRRVKQLSDDGIKWAPFDKPKPQPLLLSWTNTTASTSSIGTSTTASTALASPFTPPFVMPSRIPSGLSSAGKLAPNNNARAMNATSQGTFTDRNNDNTPELSAPPSIYPETERPAVKKGAYIPPHKRLQVNQQQEQAGASAANQPKKPMARAYIPPHLRENKKVAAKPAPPPSDDTPGKGSIDRLKHSTGTASLNKDPGHAKPSFINLGGCADPRIVSGSITDPVFVPRKASKLRRELRTDPFGYSHKASAIMTWDIGAVSECGIRDSNEDSYLVAGNLLEALTNGEESSFNRFAQDHPPGLFCVFDGHLGDQAARFSAERLTKYLEDETLHDLPDDKETDATSFVQGIMRRALKKLDEDFCKLCVKEGREWESGATALLAAMIDNHLVVANLGDARAIACRSVDKETVADALKEDGWSCLPESDSGSSSCSCMWIEMSETHSPSREDERRRIDMANGWITYEQQIPIAQLHRLNLQDADVFDIIQRCFADRYESSPKAAAPQRVVEISRVCGELAVSRALGDRDFKAAFNNTTSSSSISEGDPDEISWDSPLFLSFPDDHSRSFRGDLISNTPEFRTLKVGDISVREEFFLFACDGLWDVMDPDDAVRVTRDLLFDKKWPAREAAARLAELAVHLGSSDNITVIVLALKHHNSDNAEVDKTGA